MRPNLKINPIVIVIQSQLFSLVDCFILSPAWELRTSKKSTILHLLLHRTVKKLTISSKEHYTKHSSIHHAITIVVCCSRILFGRFNGICSPGNFQQRNHSLLFGSLRCIVDVLDADRSQSRSCQSLYQGRKASIEHDTNVGSRFGRQGRDGR